MIKKTVPAANLAHLAVLAGVVAVLAAGLLLSACGSGPSTLQLTPVVEPTATPKPTTGRGVGDTLRMLHPQAPTTLNPHLSLAVKDVEPSRITYEPLATFDKDGNLIPFLASGIPSFDNGGLDPGGKWVIWKLKQGIKWSDGEPFTADDVLFTYQFISNPDVKAATASTYASVAGVEVIDALTVKINFKDVTPAWALPFVGAQGLILPRHIFEDYNGPNARQAPGNSLPVGTGPYRVMPPGIKPQEVLLLGTQLVETNKIVFEPNPYFREADKPYFSRIEYRGGGTPGEAARMVLKDGQVDYAYTLGELSLDTITSLQAGGTGQLVTNFGSNVERILLNHTDPNRETDDGERSSLQFPHPFFSDERVRQAFAHAINRDAIVALYGQTARPTTNNLVAPPQYNSPNVFYEYDLDKARALLNEAGWVDSDGDGVRDKNKVKMKVVFQATVGTALQQTQQIVKDSLEAIGVEVELKIVDASIMFGAGSTNPDSIFRFNADLAVLWIKSTSPDPSAYMRFWTCPQVPQKSNEWRGLNIERWCSSDYDALYQQSTVELDPDTRQQLLIQMNDMLVKNVVMIPVAYLADTQGASQSLLGVDSTPWDKDTWNIKDWRRAP